MTQDQRREKIVGINEGKVSGRCPLCQCDGAQIVDQFPFGHLRELYLRTCGIDILKCLDGPYDDELIYLHECQECGLEFYPRELCGNHNLYNALQNFDYYYMKDKWEFETALLEVQEARNVLEIGCGPGFFLDKVRTNYPDKKTKGLELNRDAIRMCRANGLNVEARTIQEFALEHEKEFDLVCAFQVLEHVPGPIDFLESILRCLREGGVCVITVPNAQGFTQYAINDFGNMPPHHLTRWTPDVIRRMAKMLGTNVERILAEPVADYHKGWYRDTMTVRLFSAALGLRWRRIEVGTMYRLVFGACHRLQDIIPNWAWRYKRFPGHTLYVALRKLPT